MALIDENIINDLVRRKVITDTFRRLAPEKKEKLYKTALQQFGKYGYDGLAVDQYCYQARISKGSFFQYFPSKSHLLEFCLLIFDNAMSVIMEHIKQNETAVLAKDKLASLLKELTSYDFLDDIEKRFYLFVTNALYHSAITIEGINTERHLNSYIAEIIGRGIETKEIRADYSESMTTTIAEATFSANLKRFFLTNTPIDESNTKAFVSILFDGIRT